MTELNGTETITLTIENLSESFGLPLTLFLGMFLFLIYFNTRNTMTVVIVGICFGGIAYLLDFESPELIFIFIAGIFVFSVFTNGGDFMYGGRRRRRSYDLGIRELFERDHDPTKPSITRKILLILGMAHVRTDAKKDKV